MMTRDRRFFSWLPYHDDQKAFLSVVFGSPIDVVQAAEPSDEQIDEIWEQYIAQVRGLYDTYKGKYGYPEDEVLVIKEAKSCACRRTCRSTAMSSAKS